MIKHTSFKHGWYYHYRFHAQRLEELPSRLSNLKEYLNKVFDCCPDEHFLKGPRSSSLKFDMGIEPTHIPGHEICQIADLALQQEVKVSPHTKVQKFMLSNDPKTLSTEIPLWILSEELPNFKSIFDADLPLSGHIDLLRMENNNIGVWDFKPNAMKENYAATQVYFYAVMLSQRTKIPLDRFSCGYFDDKDAFIFKPELKLIDTLMAKSFEKGVDHS